MVMDMKTLKKIGFVLAFVGLVSASSATVQAPPPDTLEAVKKVVKDLLQTGGSASIILPSDAIEQILSAFDKGAQSQFKEGSLQWATLNTDAGWIKGLTIICNRTILAITQKKVEQLSGYGSLVIFDPDDLETGLMRKFPIASSATGVGLVLAAASALVAHVSAPLAGAIGLGAAVASGVVADAATTKSDKVGSFAIGYCNVPDSTSLSGFLNCSACYGQKVPLFYFKLSTILNKNRANAKIKVVFVIEEKGIEFLNNLTT